MAELIADRPKVSTEDTWLVWFTKHETLVAVCSLFAFALVSRGAAILINHFDGLYGQDAYAYFDFAKAMVYSIEHGQAPTYFWWPIGYPALLNVGFLLFGEKISSAQWITVLCGAAIAPVTYLLTREASLDKYGRAGGVLAGVIIATGGQAIQSSVVIMADAPSLLGATCSAWLLLKFRRTKNLAHLILSAFFLGIAVITRWQNLILVLVYFLALALIVLPQFGKLDRGIERRGRTIFNFLRTSTPILLALLIFCLILVPQLALGVAHPAPLAGQDWLEGWNPSNFFARSFNNVDGHFDFVLPPVLFYAQPIFHPAFLFPLLTPFFFAGAWILANRFRDDPAPAVLLVGWCITMYIFLAGIPYENFRFGLGFFVPVTTLTGIGVAWVWEEIGHQPSINSQSRAMRFGLAVVLGVALVGSIYWQPRVLRPVLAQKTSELAQIEWLGRELPSNATLFTFGVNAALHEYSGLHVADLWDDSPQSISGHARASAPSYLFIDKQNFDTQWRGLEPQETYFALRDNVGLDEVGEIEGWTLFKVGN